ncbi:MAG: phosphotransferase [Solirubrobacterales bacterium]
MTCDVGSIFGVRSLAQPSTRISTAEAARIAARHWGVEGVAQGLPAEVDENFRLTSESGTFLLKVVPPDEPEALTDLVVSALIHTSSRVRVSRVQEVLMTRPGSALAVFADAAGNRRRARLTTFLEGTVLRSAPIDERLRRRLGAALADLGVALRDFDHPAADRDLSWDLRHAGRMRAMLAEMQPTERRRSLDSSLQAFDDEVVPRLDRLPVQVVHNDLSKDNVVLADRGGLGVIDFGDVVRTQRANDVAVAMADHLGPGARPFEPALDLVRGYLEVEPLLPEEIGILYELTRTRIVTRIVGGEWRASRFPENQEYLGRNVERLWEVLRRLPRSPSAEDRGELEAIAEAAG